MLLGALTRARASPQMSNSNVLSLTRKQAARISLEEAVAEYLDRGGEISRGRYSARAELRCSCCGYVGRLVVALAVRQQRHCTRCGSVRVVVAF
jgi:hypothetical protein